MKEKKKDYGFSYDLWSKHLSTNPALSLHTLFPLSSTCVGIKFSPNVDLKDCVTRFILIHTVIKNVPSAERVAQQS